MTLEEIYNSQLAESKRRGSVDTNKISDGYHTFGELYEHRIHLFIALGNVITLAAAHKSGLKDTECWKSKRHNDGTIMEGWFIAGIGTEQFYQISYHIPLSKWDSMTTWTELENAPPWDGHTSKEVLERLKQI